MASIAAVGAAVALTVAGVIQLVDEQSSESTSVGIEHLGLAMFSATLLLLIPVVLHLGRRSDVRPAVVAVVGQTLLATLSIVSNIRGEDPSFFAAVAAPANLAILAGWVVLAVALKRSGVLPTFLAVALPLTLVLTLPLAMFGGGLVAALYWLAVARELRGGVELSARPAAA